MSTLKSPPDHLLISTREFFIPFKNSFVGVGGISHEDAVETLTQIVECLSTYGRNMLRTMDMGNIPELNRMRNTGWQTNPELRNQWRKSATEMAESLVLYLEQVGLFDAQHRFDYMITNVNDLIITLDFFPF